MNGGVPSLVTLLGIVMLVKLTHPLNVPSSILVTLSGIVTSVSPKQPENAPPETALTIILVVPAGIV
jgi:hypothetical protein